LSKSRIRKFTDNLKVEKGCAICGYNKISSALDLHHVIGEKTGNMGDLQWKSGYYIALHELMKCIVLCATHHREVHAGLYKNSDLVSKVITEEDTGISYDPEGYSRKKAVLKLVTL